MSTWAGRTFLGKPLTFWWQTVQNVVAYFVVSFVALWAGPAIVAAVDSGTIDSNAVAALLDFDVIQKAGIAAAIATFGFVKSLLGGAIGNKASTSWLPTQLDPTAIHAQLGTRPDDAAAGGVVPGVNPNDGGQSLLYWVLVILGILLIIAVLVALL